MISRWVDVPSDVRRSLSHEEHFLKKLLWRWLWCWFCLAWNFSTVVFTCANWVQKKITSAPKDLTLLLLYTDFVQVKITKWCARRKNSGLIFFTTSCVFFFWACLRSVWVGHLWLGCSERLQPLLTLSSCFHFSGMLRTSLMWYFPEWTGIQPQESFCFTCSSAPLLLLKVGLDRMILLQWSQTYGNISTIVGTQWFYSVFLKHIPWGVRVKEQLSLLVDTTMISDFCLLLSCLIHCSVGLPIRRTWHIINCIINYIQCFLL